MKKLYSILFLTLLTALFSCTKKDKDNLPITLFEHEINVSGNSAISSAQLNTPEQIILVDSLLVVHDKFVFEDEVYLYKVYNVIDHSLINFFGREGRGPDEFHYPSFMSRVPGSTAHLGIHNRTQTQFNMVSIDRLLNGTENISESVYSLSPNYFRAVKNGDHFIGTGRFSNGRYAVSDTAGSIIFNGGDYPFQDLFDLYSQSAGMAFQSRIAVHHDGEKAVSATSSSANLEIIEGNNEKLSTISKHHSYPPMFDDESTGEDFVSVSLNPENRWGYHNIDISKEFIYALFSGKKMGESDDFFYSNTILVFNWSGEPVLKINLDKEVSDITVHQNNKGVYGIFMDEDGNPEIIYFDLEDRLSEFF